MDDEDNPPSYSDAMAAIADGMRRQGIQSRHSFTPAEMSGHFSDVIVIFPPSRDSLSSGGSSFQLVDPSLPSAPPPPYTEHPLPPAPTQDDPTQAPSLTGSFTSHQGSLGQISTPSRDPSGQETKSRVFHDEINRIARSHRDNTFPDERYNSDLAIGGSRSQRDTTLPDFRHDFGQATGGAETTKKEPELDPSLPGRIIVEQSDVVISSSSPPSTDIKWSGPENASSFSGLTYVVEIHASSRPNLPCRPASTAGFGSDWLEVLDTSRPSIRVYHTPSSLMIGPAKWSLKDPMSVHNLKIRLRVRAVDGNNRLPSCNKGPWSQEIDVRYIDTTLITESQEKAFIKNKKTRIPSTSKEEPKPVEDKLSTFRRMDQLSSHTLLGITLKHTEYHIGKDSSIQTNISWTMPANSGCFHKVWYEVQCINKAPLAYCLKGAGKIVEELCGRNAPASVGQLDAWMTIAEVSSASLRVQKLANFLSVGQYKWELSDTDSSFCIELRIRPVALRRNGVLTGPWSDTVTVYINKEETKTLH